jgi:hypothetical protein
VRRWPSGKNVASTSAASNPDIGPQSRPCACAPASSWCASAAAVLRRIADAGDLRKADRGDFRRRLRRLRLAPGAKPTEARRIVDGGFTSRYDYALEALTELPYDKWREYDPEDTVRFYALRLREAGLIKSTPQKLIAEHTDWRFLEQLKRELKA